jgi:hypothetical protein
MTQFRLLIAATFLTQMQLFAQPKPQSDPCTQSATIVVFRSFNMISLGLTYKLFSRDTLLGRMRTHRVFIIETYDSVFSLHATTRAPSLNASRKSNYTKVKNIKYPFTVQPGQLYVVKCGFLNQDVFNHPRQPTIRLLKKDEAGRYLKKPFIKRKVKRYLYNKWKRDKNQPV